YGVQMAYRAMKKAIGEDKLDRIVDADLQMTHRELFFNSIAMKYCTSDRRSQWLYMTTPKDVHNGFLYRVNGVLGQLPDFNTTFACYDDDLMTFPESSMCPVFSEKLA
ncbi:hypothetical protein PFISCL1PPCAC_25065, partial [Pristionchus fissidentatus]